MKYHVKNILRKLGATNRADAVARFVRGGRRARSGTGGRPTVTATLSRQGLAGPLDIELQGRVAAAVAQARALLGDDVDAEREAPGPSRRARRGAAGS